MYGAEESTWEREAGDLEEESQWHFQCHETEFRWKQVFRDSRVTSVHRSAQKQAADTLLRRNSVISLGRSHGSQENVTYRRSSS